MECAGRRRAGCWRSSRSDRSVSSTKDDRNTLILRSATLVDASADGPLGRSTRWVAAIENLFNTEYDTGRTPLRTIGTPLTVRVGLRFDFR